MADAIGTVHKRYNATRGRYLVLACLSLLGLAADAAQRSATTLVYRTVTGHDLKADIYVPEGKAARPALFWIHGGGLITGHRSQLYPALRDAFLEAGFVVVAIDYRLAPVTKLPGIVEDLTAAYAWLQQTGPSRFGVDAGQVVVAGNSAGGYLALLAGFGVQRRPKAVISFWGYGDITGTWYTEPSEFYLTVRDRVSRREALAAVGGSPVSEAPNPSERGLFYLYCRQQGRWPVEVTGHDPLTEPDWFTPFLPVRNVSSDYPPTLLIHGENDSDVPFEMSAQMADELDRRDIPHVLLAVPGAEHELWGSDPETVAETFARAVEFATRHVKFRGH
jgi:acetyl esterase/lipase